MAMVMLPATIFTSIRCTLTCMRRTVSDICGSMVEASAKSMSWAVTRTLPRHRYRRSSHHCSLRGLGRLLSGSDGDRRLPAMDTSPMLGCRPMPNPPVTPMTSTCMSVYSLGCALLPFMVTWVVTVLRRPTGKARASVAGGAVTWRAIATVPQTFTSSAPARGWVFRQKCTAAPFNPIANCSRRRGSSKGTPTDGGSTASMWSRAACSPAAPPAHSTTSAVTSSTPTLIRLPSRLATWQQLVR
mmetsp:Transcript_11025/g.33040  ORF Transcript_11025/g.33040 Transcript_11025/m.33040 type:complete len:243 (-) Transcript_11025:4767-5495(-)